MTRTSRISESKEGGFIRAHARTATGEHGPRGEGGAPESEPFSRVTDALVSHCVEAGERRAAAGRKHPLGAKRRGRREP